MGCGTSIIGSELYHSLLLKNNFDDFYKYIGVAADDKTNAQICEDAIMKDANRILKGFLDIVDKTIYIDKLWLCALKNRSSKCIYYLDESNYIDKKRKCQIILENDLYMHISLINNISNELLIERCIRCDANRCLNKVLESSIYSYNVFERYSYLMASCDSIRCLIDTYNDTYLNKQDKYGKTALHYAATHNSIQCIKFLIKHGAQDLPDCNGVVPSQIMMNASALNEFGLMMIYVK